MNMVQREGVEFRGSNKIVHCPQHSWRLIFKPNMHDVRLGVYLRHLMDLMHPLFFVIPIDADRIHPDSDSPVQLSDPSECIQTVLCYLDLSCVVLQS